jgi:lipoprotein NlpD
MIILIRRLAKVTGYLTVACLLLAACSARQTPAPVGNVQNTISLKNRVKNSLAQTQYAVKKGDTLYSIAWRAGLDIRQIAGINKISAPYKIFPGQNLILSKITAEVSTNKRASAKWIKSSNQTTAKIVKKPVALNKKLAYGKKVSGQKVNNNTALKSATISQKVRKWYWPVKGKVISTFSAAQQGSKGINIAGHRGDRVQAAADGKVVYAGNALRGYGKLIIIKHNDDYLSAYAHNDQIEVTEQQQVKAGDPIARMGNTDSDRVMLHFEVRFRGKSVNPMKYLPKQ